MLRSALLLLCLGACAALPPSRDAGELCPDPGEALPGDVFCIGLYDGRDANRIAAGVRPYRPGVVLWSDGAEKRRYLFIPDGGQIDTQQLDAWKFPVGTRAWKEFRFDGGLVETRVLWKRSSSQWLAGTYVWDTEGHATLNTSAPHGVVLPSGYEIPTVKDCDKCHHGGSDRLLGVEAVALSLPEAEGATLTQLAADGLLSHPPEVTTRTLPDDGTGRAATALGYLHANCGMPCHSTRGLGDETQLVLRLRADELWSEDGGVRPAQQTASYLAMVNQPPLTPSVAQQFPGAIRVVPGAHAQSLVWLVADKRGTGQMPPLVSHQVDEVGMRQLAEWIDALR